MININLNELVISLIYTIVRQEILIKLIVIPVIIDPNLNLDPYAFTAVVVITGILHSVNMSLERSVRLVSNAARQAS